MRRPIAAAVVVILGTVIGVSGAVAATLHPLSATIRSNKVETVRGTTVEGGVIRGGLGEGATVIRFRQVSTSRATITFKVWYDAGTFTGAVTVALTAHGTKFTGTGLITGGTGRFAGATGAFTTHANRSTTGLWVQQLSGSLVF
jgi:hypothetical protein